MKLSRDSSRKRAYPEEEKLLEKGFHTYRWYDGGMTAQGFQGLLCSSAAVF